MMNIVEKATLKYNTVTEGYGYPGAMLWAGEDGKGEVRVGRNGREGGLGVRCLNH